MTDSSYLRLLRDGAVNGQVPTYNASTARFERDFPAGYDPTFAIQDFYVTPAGDDANGDGSLANPFATPQRAAEAIGPYRLARVHMASGTYTSPRLHSLKGPVVFVGDGAGVVGDDGLTVELAPAAAGAGTGAQTVTGAFAPGAFDGFAIQMLSGDATGQRRTIVETTATDLIPVRAFSPAPGAGDSYRVVSPAIVWDNFLQDDAFVQDCGAPTALTPGIIPSVIQPFVAAGILEALHLVNIRFDGGFSTLTMVNSNVFLWGCDAIQTAKIEVRGGFLGAGADSLQGVGSQIAHMLGIGTSSAYAGYAYFNPIGPGASGIQMVSSTFFGYVVAPDMLATAISGSMFTVLGGRLQIFGVFENSLAWLQRISATITRITGGVTAVECAGNSRVTVDGGVELDGTVVAVRAYTNGQIEAQGSAVVTSAAGDAAETSQGGKLYLRGTPAGTWAGGGVDFRVSAAETAAAAFFAAIDATLAAAVLNGSLITRIS